MRILVLPRGVRFKYDVSKLHKAIQGLMSFPKPVGYRRVGKFDWFTVLFAREEKLLTKTGIYTMRGSSVDTAENLKQVDLIWQLGGISVLATGSYDGSAELFFVVNGSTAYVQLDRNGVPRRDYYARDRMNVVVEKGFPSDVLSVITKAMTKAAGPGPAAPRVHIKRAGQGFFAGLRG